MQAQAQQVLDAHLEFERVERHHKKIGGSGLKRLIAVFRLAVARHHDNRHIFEDFHPPEFLQEAVGVHAGHTVVGDDEIRRCMAKRLQRFAGAGESRDVADFWHQQR